MTFLYGDVILLENLFMNYIILWSTAKALKLNYSKLKLVLASLIGAVYALLSYFPSLKYMNSFYMKLLLSLLIVVIAYTPAYIKEFAKYTGVFYLVSFIFGGAAFGLYYFISGLKSTINGVTYISHFPVKTLLIAILIAYLIVKYCWDYIQYKVSRERVFTELCIHMSSKAINIKALVDTGNSLTDPISKTPVIIAEYCAISELLPIELQSLFEQHRESNLNLISSIMASTDWVTRFRVIPFKSLGKENGMLIGFKPDEVYLIENSKRLLIKSAIIGIYNSKLSNKNEYSALIHPDVFCIEGNASKAS